MSESVDLSTTRQIPFSDADFKDLARLACREFGLDLAESKKPLVHSRLSRRLRACRVSRFSDYLALLEKDPSGEERQALISALTTNVTSFFRERHHFDTLEHICLPDARKRVASGGRVRIWSAGCSTGEEPYSIAMTILAVWPDAARSDVRILATDIDPAVVKRAKAGRYGRETVEAIPVPKKDRWFMDTARDIVTIGAAAGKMVTFAELNLVGEWPFRGPFDAIFCRNVAIYFDQTTQQTLWRRFSDMLLPGGLLFIGHSERVSGPAQHVFEPIGITSYRKSVSADRTHQIRSAEWV